MVWFCKKLWIKKSTCEHLGCKWHYVLLTFSLWQMKIISVFSHKKLVIAYLNVVSIKYVHSFYRSKFFERISISLKQYTQKPLRGCSQIIQKQQQRTVDVDATNQSHFKFIDSSFPEYFHRTRALKAFLDVEFFARMMIKKLTPKAVSSWTSKALVKSSRLLSCLRASARKYRMKFWRSECETIRKKCITLHENKNEDVELNCYHLENSIP